ncbi:amino acid ABC transporter substrate-binding protein [Fructilactobacillus sanfranciscensis]|uniref:amino acid ABC transporter substrate-binding protein n=1 Tax=Fructilactobacillus sanfranciscensis TaxID=1625 RepID=UPI000CD45A6F|nr:amino acid ABC transporter substrate-binding protein [Fructilactobacillus sanfranciscensis]MCG7195090.1 amino acid ABC transporter substrate-binding protein [Fructilactobacillus sanfranciscensis]MCG7196279.1 amino acid ABC transporter substrate-binding protein [Fructilactobacillus sanfranciscensis]MDN4462258.1 amino acid ABC transporter substrate-binding protein [Fructilactobacillus sanfranciscensis]MVF15531.1 amino acid ABC transporter substrate-binding protein [Fructilactobacillus sanfranc
MKTKKQFPKWLGNTLILILLVLVVAGAWYKGTHRTDTWNKVHQQKTVTIGIDDTFVPMGFRDKKGKLIGYDVEMAKAAFEKMGLKPKFQVIDWSMKETELNTGHIDAIWNGYTMTPERAKHAAFTKPYHEDNQVLLTKANSGINTPQDMHGKQLGVQSGSVGFDDFNQNPKVLKQYLGTKPVQYDTFDKAINDVKVGRINAVLIDGDYAKYYLAHNHSNEPMKLVKTNFPPDYDAVGLRKQDKTLREKLNKAIENLHRDGTEARLSKKYFGDPDAVK